MDGLLDSAAIRILLAPVGPISKSVFEKYARILSSFKVLPLSDVIPLERRHLGSTSLNEDSKGSSVPLTQCIPMVDKYLEQFYVDDGQLHVSMSTSYSSDHAPWEDLHFHKQVIAVIGIMNCQEIGNIKEGYKRFQSILSKYPRALASRCFAVEPSESHADDTKGVIMIPNVGVPEFYCGTMLNDLCNDILVSFAALAMQVEKKPLIAAPVFPILQPVAALATVSQITAVVASPASGGGANAGPLSVPPSAHLTSPPMRDVYPQSAGGVDSPAGAGFMGGLLAADKNKRRTPGRQQKLIADIYTLAGRYDLAMGMYTQAIESAKSTYDYLWQGAAAEGHITASLLHLLQQNGIGMSPAPSPRMSPAASPHGSPPGSPKGAREAKSVSPSRRQPQDATHVLVQAALKNPQTKAYVSDLPERYRDVCSLYAKADQTIHPFPQIWASFKIAKFLSLLYKSSFNGSFLNGAAVGFIPTEVKGISEFAQNMGIAPQRMTSNVSVVGQGSSAATSNPDRIVVGNGIGVTPFDVNSWIMKIYSSGLEYLPVPDQIWCAGHAASIYTNVNLHRKSAFFLRQAAWLASNFIQVDTTESSPGTLPAGSLSCMLRVLDVLGVGIDYNSLIQEDVSLEWFDEYGRTDDLDNPKLDPSGSLLQKNNVKFGWPEMQIRTLNESVDLAESCQDYATAIVLSTRLLQYFYRQLSRESQSELFQKLQRMAAKSKSIWEQESDSAHAPALSAIKKRHARRESLAKVQAKPKGKDWQLDGANVVGTLPPLVSRKLGTFCQVPILRRVEAIPPTARKQVFVHSIEELGSTGAQKKGNDPFIYDPFANKGGEGKPNAKKAPATFVVGQDDTVSFSLVLANPFSFDLDIQSMLLRTSGVEFSPNLSATIIPANAKAYHVQLSGTAKGSGKLHVHGCTVRMFGASLEEDISPIHSVITDPKKVGKDGKRKAQDERERYGKKALSFLPPKAVKGKGKGASGLNKELPETPNNSKSTESGTKAAPWSILITIVPVQPILQASIRESLQHGALMLIEGEKSSFNLALENIGTVDVDFVTIVLEESRVLEPARGDAVEFPEDVYERDVYGYSVQAMWLCTETEEGTLDQRKFHKGPPLRQRVPLKLTPGKKHSLCIGVYGKHRCTGGTIRIEYGCVGDLETSAEEDENSKKFYTRQLNIPILFTVQRALIVSNMDLIGISGTSRDVFTQKSTERHLSVEEIVVAGVAPKYTTEMVPADGPSAHHTASTHCLFTLDVRNAWSNPFEISFQVFDDRISNQPASSLSSVIHAGCTKRIILPLRRWSLTKDYSSKPIPYPEWKQFIRTQQAKLTESDHAIRRTLFWNKEALIGGLEFPGRVVAKWSSSPTHKGRLELRSLKLTEMTYRILKPEEIGCIMTLVPSPLEQTITPLNKVLKLETNVAIKADGALIAKRLSEFKYEAQVGRFVGLQWNITYSKEAAGQLAARLMIIQDFRNGHMVADLVSKGMVVRTGSSAVVLPPTPLGQDTVTIQWTVPVAFMKAGTVGIGLCVRKVTPEALLAGKPDPLASTEQWTSDVIWVEVREQVS